MDMTSPLLQLPGAVAGEGADAGVAWHYGDPYAEQRALEAGTGFVDLSDRGVLRISGPDRLEWLHSLTSQHLTSLAPGVPTQTLVLSPQGHLEHLLHLVDDGTATTVHVEPGTAGDLAGWLDSMRFMMRVEVAEATGELAVLWLPDRERAGGEGRWRLIPREELAGAPESFGPPAGRWAYDALRIARGEPRPGVDTDHRSIPNELGLIGPAVHLDKGCYRGQETVARVHTLGRPPRRLTLLHLDGSVDRLPAVGSPLEADGRAVGFIGSSARHHELGPIGLGLVKRAVPVDQSLLADGIAVSQEVVVDPEIGLHVRPRMA